MRLRYYRRRLELPRILRMWQWWSRRSGPQWKLGLCILRRRPWMVQDGGQRAGRSDLQCGRASATAGSIRHGDQGSGGSKRAGNDPPPPRRPTELQRTQSRRERIQHAMNHLVQDTRLTRVNLTGEDARLMKGWPRCGRLFVRCNTNRGVPMNRDAPSITSGESPCLSSLAGIAHYVLGA